MKLPVLSASSTEEWISCALRAYLPEERRPPGEAAQIGTRFHSLVEKPIVAKQWVPLDALDECFEVPLRNTIEWLHQAMPTGEHELLAEQAYELAPMGSYVHEPGKREPHWRDSLTCKTITMTGHRAYPNTESRIYGTADVVIIEGKKGHVIDWKTGRKSSSHEAQLKTLCLMASEAHKLSSVQGTAVYVNLKSGKVEATTWLFDAFDLHVHAGAIVSLSKQLLTGKIPDANPGKYCFFCPALGCPEKLRTTR